MAECLVTAVSATNSNPKKDVLCYKRGDVAAVFPDGHEWGKKEGPPKFLVVQIPGTVEEVKAKLGLLEEDQDVDGNLKRRRKRALKIDGLSNGEVISLEKAKRDIKVKEELRGG